MTDLPHALRNLRHLYEQLLTSGIRSQPAAAKGLLGPAIEAVEIAEQDLATAATCIRNAANERARMAPVVAAALKAVNYEGETPPDWDDADWLALEAAVEAYQAAAPKEPT